MSASLIVMVFGGAMVLAGAMLMLKVLRALGSGRIREDNDGLSPDGFADRATNPFDFWVAVLFQAGLVTGLLYVGYLCFIQRLY